MGIGMGIVGMGNGEWTGNTGGNSVFIICMYIINVLYDGSQ